MKTPCCCLPLGSSNHVLSFLEKDSVTLAFWKQLPSTGKTNCHNTHGLLRISKEKEMSDTTLCRPGEPRTWQVWGEEEGAGERYLQFHETLWTHDVSWNNKTQRRSFCVKLCGLENSYTKYFMIILSRPLLITWPKGPAVASFLGRLEHFPLQKNLKRGRISKAIVELLFCVLGCL